VTLGDLGNIGDFIGGVLVAVSVIYLATQIRQNTKSLRAAAYQEAVHGANEWSNILVHEKDHNRLLYQGCRDHSSLSPEELNQFSHLMMIFIRNYAVAAHLEENDLITVGIRGSYENGIRDLFRRTSMLVWLSNHESVIDPTTVARIRSIVASQNQDTARG